MTKSIFFAAVVGMIFSVLPAQAAGPVGHDMVMGQLLGPAACHDSTYYFGGYVRFSGKVELYLTLETNQFGYVMFEAFSDGQPIHNVKVGHFAHAASGFYTATATFSDYGMPLRFVAIPFNGNQKNYSFGNFHCHTASIYLE